MLLKLGVWLSTVLSSLSNQASFSSVPGHTSGRNAVLSRDTQRRDNTSPGEPATSLTWKTWVTAEIYNHIATSCLAADALVGCQV